LATDYKTLRERERVGKREGKKEKEIPLHGGTIQFLTVFL
jgi:hypothetical protein